MFETSDLFLAAFLKARGLKYLDKRKDGKRVVFIFEDSETRGELIRAFYNDGQIGVGSFKSSLDELRSLLFM